MSQHDTSSGRSVGQREEENEDAIMQLAQEDDFRMWCMKVIPCSKRYVHDWGECPFAHAGEKAVRRDPRTHEYTGIACPDMKKSGSCLRGDDCPYAHNVFEYWLHPTRYRTQLCNDGPQCRRSICFFAHSLDELRVPASKPYVSPEALARASLNAIHRHPHPLGQLLGSPLGPSTPRAGMPGMMHGRGAHSAAYLRPSGGAGAGAARRTPPPVPLSLQPAQLPFGAADGMLHPMQQLPQAQLPQVHAPRQQRFPQPYGRQQQLQQALGGYGPAPAVTPTAAANLVAGGAGNWGAPQTGPLGPATVWSPELGCMVPAAWPPRAPAAAWSGPAAGVYPAAGTDPSAAAAGELAASLTARLSVEDAASLSAALAERLSADSSAAETIALATPSAAAAAAAASGGAGTVAPTMPLQAQLLAGCLPAAAAPGSSTGGTVADADLLAATGSDRMSTDTTMANLQAALSGSLSSMGSAGLPNLSAAEAASLQAMLAGRLAVDSTAESLLAAAGRLSVDGSAAGLQAALAGEAQQAQQAASGSRGSAGGGEAVEEEGAVSSPQELPPGIPAAGDTSTHGSAASAAPAVPAEPAVPAGPAQTSSGGAPGTAGGPAAAAAATADLAHSLASMKIERTQQQAATSAASNHEIVISTLHQILKDAISQQAAPSST